MPPATRNGPQPPSLSHVWPTVVSENRRCRVSSASRTVSAFITARSYSACSPFFFAASASPVLVMFSSWNFCARSRNPAASASSARRSAPEPKLPLAICPITALYLAFCSGVMPGRSGIGADSGFLALACCAVAGPPIRSSRPTSFAPAASSPAPPILSAAAGRNAEAATSTPARVTLGMLGSFAAVANDSPVRTSCGTIVSSCTVFAPASMKRFPARTALFANGWLSP